MEVDEGWRVNKLRKWRGLIELQNQSRVDLVLGPSNLTNLKKSDWMMVELSRKSSKRRKSIAQNDRKVAELTFFPRGRRYLPCGSDGGDVPPHELCGLLPGTDRVWEEDWQRKMSNLPVRRAVVLVEGLSLPRSGFRWWFGLLRRSGTTTEKR
jgi:hypothetical protein